LANIVEATSDDFESEVLESDKVTLVDFWAEWCAPCRMLAPTLEELAQDHEDDLKIVKVNVDEDGELAQEYGVMSIPTMIVFKDGEAVERIVGVMPKDKIEKQINEYI